MEEIEVKDVGLSKSDLWDIAEYIVKKQNASTLISDEHKKSVDWYSITEDWFTFLEERFIKD